ncbi:hypothetical protein [Cellulomonas cellasea]|uniref:Transposase n=1 Tax=Cellulomonas cellasea TaxID=43670 RepID=A0A7W4UH64_9CELL|nr:hypothetical protein [Cellulomonas cellasea]MBB2924090.1 hypothetical protein [Cellulomonas cellasea]
MGLKAYTDDDRSGDYTWSADDRALEVVRHPVLWELVNVLPERVENGPGRPSEYPLSVYVLFMLLVAARGSHRGAASWMGKRDVWRKIRKHWAKRGIDLPMHGPSRGQCMYNRDAHLVPHWEALIDAFEQHAVRATQAQGSLTPDGPRVANPPRNCVVSGDGTVPAMPMRRDILKKRRDAGEHIDFEHHTEGGGHPVDGTKFYMQSVRGIDEAGKPLPKSRMIVSLAHVPKSGQGGEAGVAVRKILELQRRANGLRGVYYDGALRGVHLDMLMKAGLAVVSPPHKQTARREEFERVTCEHVDRSTGVICNQATRLYKENGALGIVEIVADEHATRIFHPLPRKVVARPNREDWRWYADLTLPCGHIYRVRLTSGKDDETTGFNRAEHLRMHPPGSPVYEQTYGWRNDAESSHAQLDDWLYRGRMVALTVERQALVMLSFAVANNAVAAWYHRHRERQRSLAIAA